MSDTLAIDAVDLRKTYTDGLLFRKRFEALKGITLQVRRGEIFGLLGPNGAGKTTFVKVMLGIVRRTAGTATMLGYPAGDRLGRLQVGYLPENLRIPRHLKAHQALDYYGRLSGMSNEEIRAQRESLLQAVGLAGRERDSVKKYSKGMLQRLGLAQALLHDPQLLFLDEPTDGLDPVGRNEVRNIIHRLKDEGKTVFVNSHLLQEVEMVCDRFAILDKGEVRSVGTLAEIAPQQPTEEIEVELELQGSGEAAKAGVGDRPVVESEVCGENHFRVVVRVPSQDEVDACVDGLRERGVSLVGLSRRRVTLEDAFLGIVSAAHDDENE